MPPSRATLALIALLATPALAQPPGAADSAAWRKANVQAGAYDFVADTPEAAVFIDPSDEGYDPSGVPMEMNVRHEYFAAAPGRPELSSVSRVVFDCNAGRTRVIVTEYHADRNLYGRSRAVRTGADWVPAERGTIMTQLLGASCEIRAQMASGQR
jgi:hypothetical protein